MDFIDIEKLLRESPFYNSERGCLVWDDARMNIPAYNGHLIQNIPCVSIQDGPWRQYTPEEQLAYFVELTTDPNIKHQCFNYLKLDTVQYRCGACDIPIHAAHYTCVDCDKLTCLDCVEYTRCNLSSEEGEPQIVSTPYQRGPNINVVNPVMCDTCQGLPRDVDTWCHNALLGRVLCEECFEAEFGDDYELLEFVGWSVFDSDIFIDAIESIVWWLPLYKNREWTILARGRCRYYGSDADQQDVLVRYDAGHKTYYYYSFPGTMYAFMEYINNGGSMMTMLAGNDYILPSASTDPEAYRHLMDIYDTPENTGIYTSQVEEAHYAGFGEWFSRIEANGEIEEDWLIYTLNVAPATHKRCLYIKPPTNYDTVLPEWPIIPYHTILTIYEMKKIINDILGNCLLDEINDFHSPTTHQTRCGKCYTIFDDIYHSCLTCRLDFCNNCSSEHLTIHNTLVAWPRLINTESYIDSMKHSKFYSRSLRNACYMCSVNRVDKRNEDWYYTHGDVNGKRMDACNNCYAVMLISEQDPYKKYREDIWINDGKFIDAIGSFLDWVPVIKDEFDSLIWYNVNSESAHYRRIAISFRQTDSLVVSFYIYNDNIEELTKRILEITKRYEYYRNNFTHRSKNVIMTSPLMAISNHDNRY